MSTAPAKKELLVHFPAMGIWVLVPKQRGTGFLKVPLGHHAHSPVAKLVQDWPFDVYGLDGCLWLDIGRCIYSDEERQAYIDRYIVQLSKLYGYPYRVVGHNEYWANSPT